MIYFTNTIGGLYGAGYNLDLILYFTNSLIRAHNYRASHNLSLAHWYYRGLCFNYSRAAQALSDEEQAFMLKDYAHQIIILIIALRQGRYFTT